MDDRLKMNLQGAVEIVDEVLPFKADMRKDDRTAMRQTALELLFTRLMNPVDGQTGERAAGAAQNSAARRVTVMHLTRPEHRAGNTELADADAYGWEVRGVPGDGERHPRGEPCPVCSHD
jgi:hypothetical protein